MLIKQETKCLSLFCAKNLRKTDLKTSRRNACDPAATVACGGRENPDYLYAQNMKQRGQRDPKEA